MNWSEPVNFYCERASAAFWAEPVNALTNAGFLVAALAAFVEWRRAGGRDVPVSCDPPRHGHARRRDNDSAPQHARWGRERAL
jgi:hypothetical protein